MEALLAFLHVSGTLHPALPHRGWEFTRLTFLPLSLAQVLSKIPPIQLAPGDHKVRCLSNMAYTKACSPSPHSPVVGGPSVGGIDNRRATPREVCGKPSKANSPRRPSCDEKLPVLGEKHPRKTPGENRTLLLGSRETSQWNTPPKKDPRGAFEQEGCTCRSRDL